MSDGTVQLRESKKEKKRGASPEVSQMRETSVICSVSDRSPQISIIMQNSLYIEAPFTDSLIRLRFQVDLRFSCRNMEAFLKISMMDPVFSFFLVFFVFSAFAVL